MLQLYKIRFNTADLTLSKIKEWYSTDVPSDEKLQALLEAILALHGVESAGISFPYLEGRWSIAGWDEKDDDKFRDWIYQIEQDEMFGQYSDDYEGFLKDWNANEYEPQASWSVPPELIERLEPLNNLEAIKKDIIESIKNKILADGYEKDGYFEYVIKQDLTQDHADELNALFAKNENNDGVKITGEVGNGLASVEYKASLNQM